MNQCSSSVLKCVWSFIGVKYLIKRPYFTRYSRPGRFGCFYQKYFFYAQNNHKNNVIGIHYKSIWIHILIEAINYCVVFCICFVSNIFYNHMLTLYMLSGDLLLKYRIFVAFSFDTLEWKKHFTVATIVKICVFCFTKGRDRQ